MIILKYEKYRKCGWRKEGGLYLVTPPLKFKICEKLPYFLEKCPTCGGGIKFSRGWTWINLKKLLENVKCGRGEEECRNCILKNPPEKAGLIWVGEAFYKTPQEWIKESEELGISRRINSIPRGFKVNETVVAVAHRKVNGKPGIFQVFIPTDIEYIVKKTDTTEKLNNLEKKGVKLVGIVKEPELYPLLDFNASA